MHQRRGSRLFLPNPLYPLLLCHLIHLRVRASRAGEVLEQAALLAVSSGDAKAFERNIAQLKPYYSARCVAAAKAAVTVEVPAAVAGGWR